MKSRALPRRSPGWLITVAAQKAARVCPLGKLLEVGARTGTPAAVSPRSVGSGRVPAHHRLQAALTRLDSIPATAEGPHGPGPLRAGVAGPPRRGGRPHEPVVAEPGDDLGQRRRGRLAPQRLEPGVDPVVDRLHHGRPERPAEAPGPSDRCPTGSAAGRPVRTSRSRRTLGVATKYDGGLASGSPP